MPPMWVVNSGWSFEQRKHPGPHRCRWKAFSGNASEVGEVGWTISGMRSYPVTAPDNSTWTLKIMVSKWTFLFQYDLFSGSMLNFRGLCGDLWYTIVRTPIKVRGKFVWHIYGNIFCNFLEIEALIRHWWIYTPFGSLYTKNVHSFFLHVTFKCSPFLLGTRTWRSSHLFTLPSIQEVKMASPRCFFFNLCREGSIFGFQTR